MRDEVEDLLAVGGRRRGQHVGERGLHAGGAAELGVALDRGQRVERDVVARGVDELEDPRGAIAAVVLHADERLG